MRGTGLFYMVADMNMFADCVVAGEAMRGGFTWSTRQLLLRMAVGETISIDIFGVKPVTIKQMASELGFRGKWTVLSNHVKRIK